MRSISTYALQTLQTQAGIEPVIIVRVWWGGDAYTSYCDRKFAAEGLSGKLLEIGGIEDIVDINAAASSVSLTVTLDDSDGEIKQIYNTKDIHKVYVQVLQWFNGIPLSDAFAIFEGEISSPIVWNEGARTLRFDIVTKLEDREVGFSAEEGQFDFIPASTIGVAWPLVFGRVAGVRLIQLTEAPTAILSEGFGIVDEDIWQSELDSLDAAIAAAWANAQSAYVLGVSNAYIAGAFTAYGSLPDDPAMALQYNQAAASYYAQANQYSDEYFRLVDERTAKEAERLEQRSYQKSTLTITQTNLPVGVNLTVEIGNYTATAVVNATNQMTLSNLTEKINVNDKIGSNDYLFSEPTDEYKREARGQKFNWIDGGTKIQVFNFPRHYIAGIGDLQILNVWARNKSGKAVVPAGWYTKSVVDFGGGLTATKIIFETPITSRPGEWEDGDIEIDCISEVGTNVVDIMEWVIERYCSLGIDTDSFDHVRTLVEEYPANFCVTSRIEVIQLLKDIAFQSRCAIWINDRKFFLRYLPEALAPVDTITEDDIEVNTIEVLTTDTERIVTKFTAVWRERHNQNEPNKIIYRYNIPKYGVQEEEYDFYIYNHHELVAKSAEFWMIRKSNMFKRISCKILLHKLRIETFDPVEIDLQEDIVATGAVTGVIERATFNPDDDTISIEAWLPVRLGEMTVYSFAQPMDVTDIYPVEDDPNVVTGNPYSEASGELIPANLVPSNIQLVPTPFNPFTRGRYRPIGDSGDVAPDIGSVVFQLSPSEINGARPAGIATFNNEKKYLVNPVQEFAFKSVVPSSFFGYVVSKLNEGLYLVRAYLRGFNNSETDIQVRIPAIRDGSVLPLNYPIVVHRTVWAEADGSIAFEYWAQPPIWHPGE